MKKKEIINLVKPLLSEEKLAHTLRVAELSEELAKHYNVSKKKALKAVYLHDVGYFYNNHAKDKSLSHAAVSVKFAKEHGIKDEDILKAIKYHTVGHPDMDTLAKIVYLADSCEKNRDYEGVDEVRKLLYKNLDKALLLHLQYSEKKLQKKGKRMHPDSIRLRDKLKKKVKENR